MNMEHILISMNTDNYKERMKELFKFDNNICGLGVNKIPAMKNGYESYISFVLDENKVVIDEVDYNVVKAKDKSIDKISNDVFVPDESLFTKGTLRSFKKDFKDIDFKNEYMERAFEDAVMITFDRDDVETIKANSYKFFKGTLDNKIIEYKIEEQRDIEHKNEMEKYW